MNKKTKTKLEKKQLKKTTKFFFCCFFNSNECFRMFLVSFDDGFEQPNQTKHTHTFTYAQNVVVVVDQDEESLVCCSILVCLFAVNGL